MPAPDVTPGASRPRSILHVDMDAFYVSVELLDHPELRGRPVIVGGAGERGVVAAASYEARAYGVHSAMPSVRARTLCPQAVFLPGRHERYQELSERVMALFRSFTPLVEPISLDEAFLDVTGARRLHGPAPAIARSIRDRVLDEERLTCSVGVAPTKFVAKLASEAAKPLASPDGPRPGLGVRVVEPGEVLAFLHPLPVEALWGVGPATLTRLERLGVATVGDLAGLDVRLVVGAVGDAVGHHLSALAHGIDDRPVQPDRTPKSVGHEETFARDRHLRSELDLEVVRLGDAVAARLRAHHLAGRTVTVKVRFHDFRTITRSSTVATAIDTGPAVVREARALLAGIDPSPGVRLLGVSVSGLVDGEVRQLSLDLADEGRPADGPGWTSASEAVDRIRGRFGATAIGPAALTGPDGLRPARRGAQAWGPHAEAAGDGDETGPEAGSSRGGVDAPTEGEGIRGAGSFD
jgi:DNA polymerase IV